MALKDTVAEMAKMIADLTAEMGKVECGNKAACQRVRTATIKFAKLSKTFRKESVKAAKSGALGKVKKASKKKAPKAAAKKAPAKKVAKKSASRKVAKKAPAKKAAKRKTLRKKAKR